MVGRPLLLSYLKSLLTTKYAKYAKVHNDSGVLDIHLFPSCLSVKSVSSVVEIVLSSSSLTTDYTDATDKAGEAGGISYHTIAWLHLFAPFAYFVVPFFQKPFSLQPSVYQPE
jgi:hypothetical protein